MNHDTSCPRGQEVIPSFVIEDDLLVFHDKEHSSMEYSIQNHRIKPIVLASGRYNLLEGQGILKDETLTRGYQPNHEGKLGIRLCPAHTK